MGIFQGLFAKHVDARRAGNVGSVVTQSHVCLIPLGLSFFFIPNQASRGARIRGCRMCVTIAPAQCLVAAAVVFSIITVVAVTAIIVLLSQFLRLLYLSVSICYLKVPKSEARTKTRAYSAHCLGGWKFWVQASYWSSLWWGSPWLLSLDEWRHGGRGWHHMSRDKAGWRGIQEVRLETSSFIRE